MRSSHWDRRASPDVRHCQVVSRLCVSKPASNRCDVPALRPNCWRTAASRIDNWRADSSWVSGSASYSGRFDRRAPVRTSPAKSISSRFRYQETVVLLNCPGADRRGVGQRAEIVLGGGQDVDELVAEAVVLLDIVEPRVGVLAAA